MDYQEKKNLYNCRSTVMEMLTDRGYPVPNNFKVSFEDFLLLLEENNLDLFLIKDVDDSIYVRFMHEYQKNLTKKDLDGNVEEIIELTEDPNIKIVLILKTNTTSGKDIVDKDQNVELFYQDYLTFNPTHHYLVPKHQLLNEDEIKEVLKKYCCSKAQLPKLSRSDPIAKYYGAKPGDVFEITRRSVAMGKHIYYRHVK